MEWFFSWETARFITQIGRTTTRNDVERHLAALSNKQDFFVLSDPEYFENYSKYVKLFDEIFREGAKPIHRHIAVREGVVLW